MRLFAGMNLKRLMAFSGLLFIIFTNSTVFAQTDWRKQIGVFRIGVVVDGEIALTRRHVEPFRSAMSDALDMDVELFPARSPQALIDALADERIEYAIMSASAYALVWNVCECVEPLVAARAFDSTDSFFSIIISNSATLDQPSKLASARILGAGRDSIDGHKLIVHELEKQNIQIDTDLNPIEFVSDKDGILEKFANGSFDALIGWSSMTGDPVSGYTRGTLRQLVELKTDGISNYQIIWKSQAIPHRTHLIRNKVNVEAKQILQQALVSLSEKDPIAYDVIEPLFSGGFSTVDHESYQQLIDLIDNFSPTEKPEIGSSDPKPGASSDKIVAE